MSRTSSPPPLASHASPSRDSCPLCPDDPSPSTPSPAMHPSGAGDEDDAPYHPPYPSPAAPPPAAYPAASSPASAPPHSPYPTDLDPAQSYPTYPPADLSNYAPPTAAPASPSPQPYYPYEPPPLLPSPHNPVPSRYPSLDRAGSYGYIQEPPKPASPKVVRAGHKVETSADVRSGVEKFSMKVLPGGAGSPMDVLCQFKEMGVNYTSRREVSNTAKPAADNDMRECCVDWRNSMKSMNKEKDHLVPDEAISKCTGCAANSNAFNRRQDCESCGDVVCNKCTQGRSPLTTDADAESVRICDICMAEVTQRFNNAREASNGPVVHSHGELAKKLQETTLVDEYETVHCEGQDKVEAASYRLEGLSLSTPTATAPAATSTGASTALVVSRSSHVEPIPTSIAAVLGSTDLLCEILLRLPYPSSLIRAATVNRFWLCNASDPVFLKKFLKLNPPCLLGFYAVADRMLHPCFIPAVDAQDAEIATMLTLASSQFDVWQDTPVTIWDCKNGKILVEIGGKLEAREYLTRPCSIAAYPQSPLKLVLNRRFTYQHHEFLPDIGKGHEYYRLALGYRGGCIIAYLSLLCGHIWVIRHSDVTALPDFSTSDFVVPYGKCWGRKIYLVSTCHLVIILDMETMEMHFIQIPHELLAECYDVELSPGHSGFEIYVVGLTESHLGIWGYVASGNKDTWHLINSIPIQDMFVADISLWAVGEQLEFVLFKVEDSVYQLNIDTRELIEIFQLLPEDGVLERIFPCMMIWPPIFPPRDDVDSPADLDKNPRQFSKTGPRRMPGGQRPKSLRF